MVGVVAGIALSGLSLWLGMKFTKVNGTFPAAMIIAAICGMAGLFPFIGFFLSIIVMFVLITKLTDAEFWPDAVLLVVVSNLVSWVLTFGLLSLVK